VAFGEFGNVAWSVAKIFTGGRKHLAENIENAVKDAAGGRIAGGIVRAGKGVKRIIEKHHLLPRQFRETFQHPDRGLNIDDYIVQMEREKHKIIHGKGGGEAWENSWNKHWERWIADNPERHP